MTYKNIERELGFVRHMHWIWKTNEKSTNTSDKRGMNEKYAWLQDHGRGLFGIPKPNFGSNLL